MTTDRTEPGHELTFTGTVRLIRAEDIPQLQPILETWIRDSATHQLLPDEVNDVIKAMQESMEGKNDRVYLVAEGLDGQILGTVGLKNPDQLMRSFAKTDRPAELINAYVSKEQRGGKGVGSTLVKNLEAQAVARGYTEIVLNSGPRYKESGWGFYDRLPGYERGCMVENLYRSGPAQVWSKTLVQR